MPIYQYRRNDGSIIEDIRPAELRDHCPPGTTRILVPEKISLLHRAPDPLGTNGHNMMRKLYQLECEGKLKRRFPVETYKRAWAT